MNSNARDREYLWGLRREVEQSISAYVYKVPDGALGNPMSDAAIADGLAQLRASLVEPYWAEIDLRDTFEQVGMAVPPRRKCAVLADDGKDSLLLYDPVEQSFALAQRVGEGLSTFGVRGDAVGCFLSR